MTGRRGQLVLLAAAVVVTALVPMLLAYAQLTVVVADDVTGAADERTVLADTTRTLERAVADTTTTLANGTGPDSHRAVATLATDSFAPTVTALESSGTDRGVAVTVARNASAARDWARTDCPRGPSRAFRPCAVTDGVVTQTRANSTGLVAVAFDVTVRGPDGTAAVTVVIRGVRGTVAAARAGTGRDGRRDAD
jgi:hypothetical protein